MVIVWIFICLIPRFIWELPWLLFLDQIREGVLSGSLWTYIWSPYLLGGDARYLNGDPLVVTLEWIALFVGLFETYAIVQFFRNGKRFTNNQLSFIMGGMIVEVLLPAVYFGVEIASKQSSAADAADLWIKFILLIFCGARCRSSRTSGAFAVWRARTFGEVLAHGSHVKNINEMGPHRIGVRPDRPRRDHVRRKQLK